MAADQRDILDGSVVYKWICRGSNWLKESTITRLLSNQRVLAGLLGGILVISLIRILSSGMNVAIRFLSFALLFAVLVALTWSYTKPLTEE